MPSPDSIFAAVADPRRRAILEYLTAGGKNAGEIADRFDVSWPAISRHLRILKASGLVWEMRAGRNRFYELNEKGLLGAQAWLNQFRPASAPAPVQAASIHSAVGREYTS